MKQVENVLEDFIFKSRWLLAPFYVGLVLAMALLLVKFFKAFVDFVPIVFTGTGEEVIINILTLVDVVMIANLLLIIIFAGYETFVSKIDTADSVDRPSWMGHVGFSDLKMKIMGSIVAISGIELLKLFMHVNTYDLSVTANNYELAWRIVLHIVFVLSGLVFALSDKIASGGKSH